MKKYFIEPEAEVIRFDTDDIITTSGPTGEEEIEHGGSDGWEDSEGW